MQTKHKKQVSDSSNALRFSFRLAGRSTSITLRKNIVSIWVVLSDIPIHKYNSSIYKFIEESINKWEQKGNNTAKGLSDFITVNMIQSMLQKRDFRDYKRVFSKIR